MDELKMIEKPTVEQAEIEFMKLHEEGCWQVVNPLKIVWSWKSFSYVARFTVKKVEKRYDLLDHMEMTNKIIAAGFEAAKSVAAVMANKRRLKMEQLLNKPNPNQ